MKKIMFLVATLLAIVVVGCTNTNGVNSEPTKPDTDNPNKEFSFNMTFNKEYKNSNNLYVGEKYDNCVWYDVNIKDTDPEKDIVYILKPVNTIDTTRHQVFEKHFKICEQRMIGDDSILVLVKEIKIKDKNQPNNYAFVQPLVPGLFQLDFQLQKYDTVAKKNIGEPIITRAKAFHAVQISAIVRRGMLWWQANDGEQLNDTYLSNYSDVDKYTYEFSCGNVKKVGEFKESVPYGIDSDEFGGVQNVPYFFNLTIKRVYKNSNFKDLEYKGIKIVQ